ncbi:unnamed protein product [Mytilus coruscus]|uniref:Integrase catalytic domain-containing protein n=1 Tax=Mytilus coruscus TaxID=42192 RepID=A0A6J8A2N8_MYTCO|nr:unnamed protein product [Mytilus coruscus]
MTAPIVAYPADHGGYILDTDACDTGIGAVLSQIQEGQEKVIAYGSRTLNKAERNYCVTDKELLALRYFIEYYGPFFSKWAEVYPIPDQTAETCAQKILDEFIGRFGCPESLHSDQGGSFESEIFQQLCQMLEVKKTRTSAHCWQPQRKWPM